MTTSTFDNGILGKFGPYTLVTGILLLLLGLVGIAFPVFMSFATGVFVASLFLVGGAFWAVHTYRYNAGSVLDWLKPALLLISGGLMLFYPGTGVATVGLLLAIYLLFDAMASFTLAQTIHPARGWGWMVFNGIVSVILATLFLVGWPATSLVLVGLYVGISLVFDGVSLVIIGWSLRKIQ